MMQTVRQRNSLFAAMIHCLIVLMDGQSMRGTAITSQIFLPTGMKLKGCAK